MGRPKKPVELTPLEKNYIDLCLKTSNNVNYDELFARLAMETAKPEQLIRDYADKVFPAQEPNLPPVPKKRKELTPIQESVRNQFTPGRKDPNTARHVTVMSENLAEMIEKNPATPVKGSSRYSDCVFRQ